MKRLSIFSLEAVIRYSDEQLRSLFFPLLSEISSIEITEDPAPELKNIHHLLYFIFEKELERSPSTAEISAYQKGFKKAVKILYLQDEEAFEIRPGVQSLFGQLEKESNWKYGLVSDYWGESTKFILQSCGVFSKGKLTISAENAKNRAEQCELIKKRALKGKSDDLVQFIGLDKNPGFLSREMQILRPKEANKDANYYIFPKFSELFGIKKTKSRKYV